MPAKSQPPAAGEAAHTPAYSEHGPVWRVVPIEDLPEMAVKSMTLWLVVDLDYNEREHTGYEMARCAKKSDAEFLALACNSHAKLLADKAALVAALENLKNSVTKHFAKRDNAPALIEGDISDARSALAAAKEGAT